MLESLTRGGGENVPGILGAGATRNFSLHNTLQYVLCNNIQRDTRSIYNPLQA